MLRWIIAFALLMPECFSSTQYLPEMKRWVLETDNSAYLLEMGADGRLNQLYWGAKLRSEDYRQGTFPPQEEYPGWGAGLLTEPALKVTFQDGVRDVVLRYRDHRVEEDRLTVQLKDIGYDLFVDLEFQVFHASDIISKRAVIHNATGQEVVLEVARSAVWNLPEAESYRLTHLAGRWGNETQVIHEAIQPGRKVLESRNGKTSHQANPWFAIDQGEATEAAGRVWFGTLAWSGSWNFAVEQDEAKRVRLAGGFNPFDFAYLLRPGERLETPWFYGGYSGNGFGGASRRLHRFALTQILPEKGTAGVLPVMYNHWYSTTFDVSEASLSPVAEQAAKLGVEVFVMDDGWFGSRNNDKAGLGDWFPNPQKFPNGLGPLIKRVNDLGMRFGIWVEPEMVNPDSDLYRAHPDWIINFPGRPRTQLRNQYNLNLAREDVAKHLYSVLDKLLTENRIEYVKWDMNRHFSEPGWPEVEPRMQPRLYVEYVRNLYHLIDRLRSRHPDIIWETCSGGGGRVDLGILQRTDQAWTSDNTDPFDRLKIQEGFTFAYPPRTMMSWVTDSPDDLNGRSSSLAYRFLVSMMGSLGISVNFNRGWTDADLSEAKDLIAYYKDVREIVQNGDLYRLASPREGELTAADYVSPDKSRAVLFVFRHSQQFRRPLPPVRLEGLDPSATYQVTGLANDRLIGEQRRFSGSYLGEEGLRFRLRGDFDATSVALERVR